MDKAYEHFKYEKDMYKLWESSGAFTPIKDPGKQKQQFSIMMPPPNANDNLHIGHARFVTIEDVLTRYHRMKGDPTLWLPGADHAGIETQFVFEKKLKIEGKSRFDFDRETLYKMIWDYVQTNKQVMENQLRALGASCDWTREKFTLDPEIVKIVYQTFKRLSDDGLTYRGERLVNYCTRCGTGYSELEVDHGEREAEIYTLDYGTIMVATTRPETIFADQAVAVNPKDEKYKYLVGKTAIIPLINKEIPIIADDAVEMGLGTDALKVTPGHDFTDFEIGQRHGLAIVAVIGKDGKVKEPAPEKYRGLYINEARKCVIEDLQAAGKLVETKKKSQVVGVCYRCKNPIEPLPSEQWFIKVTELAKAAKKAATEGETQFSADRFEKIYDHWLDNLRDWNVSRQIVWGIQIPAWHCEKCGEWIVTAGDVPEKCRQCNRSELSRDQDTFDTWFSSGQWPFATLKTNLPGDFEYFYPTSVMETGYDILPFWVMRMMMLGIYATGKVPFRNILLHGLVRDKSGQKISKSKGNVIDPLQMTEKYGADALRMSLVWGALIENDIALAEDNVRGMRNFANKIWNIARFVTAIPSPAAPTIENEDDRWIKQEFNQTRDKVTASLDNYRLSEAAEEIYEFIWHKFADIYLEKIKRRKEEAYPVLIELLKNSLRMLHPFMPFVTEAIWQSLSEKESPLLITAAWPEKV